MVSGDLLARYGPRALIPGGSEGIGASFAEALAAAGFTLTLVARRAEPLERTAVALRDRYNAIVDVETLDLAADDIAKDAEALLDRADPDLLIYNAGTAHGIGLFADQPAERALALARLNCLGPLAFAHGAITRMRLDSAAGFVPMQPDEVAAGALATLGSKAVHFAVGTEAADAMRTAPRAAVIDGASRAAMGLWGLEDVSGAGPHEL